MKVEVRRDVCVGAAQCVLTAPGLFDQGEDDGLVVLLKQPGDADAGAVREARILCPSGAVRIVED
jgi:ferredoxin